MIKIPYVQLFTDGSCIPNPGNGGYSWILRHISSGKEIEGGGGFELSTNSRMEMWAIISGLQRLNQSCYVNIYTDSHFLVDSIQKDWYLRWISPKYGIWKSSRRVHVANIDLWRRLLPLIDYHSMTIDHIKAHNGHDENERCDQLAKQFAKQGCQERDEGYFLSSHEQIVYEL